MRVLFLFLILCVSQVSEAMSRASPAKEMQSVPHAIGVKTLHYFDETRKRPIVVEFWYPTQIEEEGESPLRDADLFSGDSKVPLIMMSHGHRGNRLTQSWLAIDLAKKGYSVASVEHFGCSTDHFHPLLSLRFWDRFKDVSYALDQILQYHGNGIDSERIGFIGYSMGGMTGLGLAGAQARKVKEAVIRESKSIKGFSQEMIDQVDFEEGEKLHADPRIKAMLLLCPANFVYPPESLKMIKIPVGLVAAFHDEVLPHKDHAYPIICHLVPQKMKVIREKVSHMFLCPGPDISMSKSKLHQEVARFAFDFFKSQL